MAVHALADRATAGTRSCCRCCMHRHGHGIGDADLFNDQVGKIGKYRHRLILAQENVSLEILFGPLFYHIAIIEAAEEPYYPTPTGCAEAAAPRRSHAARARCASVLQEGARIPLVCPSQPPAAGSAARSGSVPL